MSDEPEPDLKEAFDEKTRKAYEDEMVHCGKPEWDSHPSKQVYDDDVVEYHIPEWLARKLVKYGCVPDPGGCNTCVFPPELGRVLYLDVGRWGGGAPSAADTPEHWGRQRSFGIVCGQLAALCNYPAAGTAAGLDLDVDPRVKATRDFKLVQPLLQSLATAEPKLGKLKVKVLHAGMPTDLSPQPSQTGEVPRSDIIHVFLGDIHAPVLDGTHSWRTLFGHKDTQKDSHEPHHVPRKGRVDAGRLAELESWVAPLMAAGVSPVPEAALLGAIATRRRIRLRFSRLAASHRWGVRYDERS